jgi:hypothetical protein
MRKKQVRIQLPEQIKERGKSVAKGGQRREESTAIVKQKLPTTQEEATWQILGILNKSHWHADRNWHTQVLKILRLYPELAKDTFFSKDYGVLTPFNHFIAVNASLELLKAVLKLNPKAVETGDASDTFPLHLACQFADLETIIFIANQYPEALWIASSECGLPLHCALWRQEQGGTGIEILKTVLEMCPAAMKLEDAEDRTALELALKRDVPLNLLQLLVNYIPGDMQEFKLEEFPEEDEKAWDLNHKQIEILSGIFPQLTRLTVKVKHWTRAGLNSLFESLHNFSSLKTLHLDIPTDIHIRHWNGEALELLQQYLGHQETLETLVLCMYDRTLEHTGIKVKLKHDETFMAISLGLGLNMSSNLKTIELQDFCLTNSGQLGMFFSSGAAPRNVRLVDFAFRGSWSEQPQWDTCRVERLELLGKCRITCLGPFLKELANAPSLKDLTIDFRKNISDVGEEDDDGEEGASKISSRKPNITSPLVDFLNHSKIESLTVKGAEVHTPPVCRALERNTCLRTYNVFACLKDEISRTSLADLLENHNRTLVELPEVEPTVEECKFWHKIEFYLSNNRFRLMGIDQDPAIGTSFAVPDIACCPFSPEGTSMEPSNPEAPDLIKTDTSTSMGVTAPADDPHVWLLMEREMTKSPTGRSYGNDWEQSPLHEHCSKVGHPVNEGLDGIR